MYRVVGPYNLAQPFECSPYSLIGERRVMLMLQLSGWGWVFGGRRRRRRRRRQKEAKRGKGGQKDVLNKYETCLKLRREGKVLALRETGEGSMRT